MTPSVQPPSDNELPEDIYKVPKGYMLKIIPAALIFFIAALILNLPLESLLDKSLSDGLRTLPCPAQYQKLTLEWFMPKIILKDVSLSAQCMGYPQSQLKFSEIKVKFKGFSLSPLGLVFAPETRYGKGKLQIRQVVGLGAMATRIENTVIDLDQLGTDLQGGVKFQGQVKITALLGMKAGKLNSGHISISSKNFSMPKQTLSMFEVPNLNIGGVEFKARINERARMSVERFVVGDQTSPIIGNVSGNITFNAAMPGSSELDLKGDVKFSQSFIDAFAIINLIFANTPKKDGYYHVQLGGTLGQPKLLPL